MGDEESEREIYEVDLSEEGLKAAGGQLDLVSQQRLRAVIAKQEKMRHDFSSNPKIPAQFYDIQRIDEAGKVVNESNAPVNDTLAPPAND